MMDKSQTSEPGNQGTGSPITIDELYDASQLALFHKQKILGAFTPGPAGVSFLKAAEATGASILMGITDDDGDPVFGFKIDGKGEAPEFLELKPDGAKPGPDAPPPKKVINIAFHTAKGRGTGLYPPMSASEEGTDKKRIIKILGFNSEKMGGDSDYDLQIANELKWSYANGRVMEGIIWIEAQFSHPEYGIINDPMVPLIQIPMYVAGGRAVQSGVERLMREQEKDMEKWGD